MNDIGGFSLLLSVFLSAYVFLGGIYAAVFNDKKWLRSVANAGISSALFILLSLLVLIFEFLQDDFSNQYIWRYSSRALPFLYKASAAWAGMDGSLLLWSAFLGLVQFEVCLRIKGYPGKLAAWVMAVVASVLLFFNLVVLLEANPFRYIRSEYIPLDGNGLNPLLQNPFMVLHPPVLYAGFSVLLMPFVLFLAAKFSGVAAENLLSSVRRWALGGWMLLTLGIGLGAYWAYIELGWGGFWAWDPVENVSLISWLLCTALLHSLVVQRKTGAFQGLNFFFSAMVWASAIFGTFITRSGVVQSVHAFTGHGTAWVFLGYLALVIMVWLVCFVYSKKKVAFCIAKGSFFSKESMIFYTVTILCCISLVVLWGILFPVLSEVVVGAKQLVDESFYNSATAPLFGALLLLMVPGLFVGWGENGGGLTTEEHGGNIHKFHLGKAQSILLHFSFIVLAISVAASMSGKQEKDFYLNTGEVYAIDAYQIRFDGISQDMGAGYEAISAKMSIYGKDGKVFKTTLSPELRYYSNTQMTASEVAVLSELKNDLYIAFLGVDEEGRVATFRSYINPLQIWVWVGLFVTILAALLRLCPFLENKS